MNAETVPAVDPKRPSSVYRKQKLAAHTTKKGKRRGKGAAARGVIARLSAAVLLLSAPLYASEFRAYRFDVDSLAYRCPALCTAAARDCYEPGPGYSNGLRITTSGSSSTTVTSVNSTAAFDSVSVGDVLTFALTSGQAIRKVTAKASSSSVTVDDAVTVPTEGVTFRAYTESVGTGAAGDGWMTWSPSGDGEVFISVDQLSATGGLDYKIEGRQCGWGYCTNPVVLQTDNLTGASAAESVARMATDKEFIDQVRVCFKLGTADDDTITIASGSTDVIDFSEPTTSFTITAGVNDGLDWTEDAGGTPIVCSGIVGAGTYTAATLAAQLAIVLNDDGNCTGALANTYSASYSATTYKFTVARATGTKTISLLWNTGTQTATSVGPTIGFPTSGDSTGATTYTSAANETQYDATLAAGEYSGPAMCVEVAAEMNAATPVNTYLCSYSYATDKITIAATGSFKLPWNTGTNNATAADTPLGFSADLSGASTYTGAALGLDASGVEQVTVTVKR